MAKEKKEKKKFSWWGLIRRVAIVTGAIFIGASLLNFVGLSLGLSTLATTIFANTALAVATVGLGGMALTAASSLVTGAVNLFRVIFSKKYRDQLKARRQARKAEKQLSKENKREKKNEKKNAKENKEELVNNTDKEKVTEELPVVEEEQVVTQNPVQTEVIETPVVTEAKAKVSNKAAGMYDKLTKESQELYNSIIKKNTPAYLFGSLSRAEAVVLKAQYDDCVKQFKASAKEGPLDETQSKEVAMATALRSKLAAYIRSKDANEKATVDNDKISSVKKEVEEVKIRRSGSK